MTQPEAAEAGAEHSNALRLVAQVMNHPSLPQVVRKAYKLQRSQTAHANGALLKQRETEVSFPSCRV